MFRQHLVTSDRPHSIGARRNRSVVALGRYSGRGTGTSTGLKTVAGRSLAQCRRRKSGSRTAAQRSVYSEWIGQAHGSIQSADFARRFTGYLLKRLYREGHGRQKGRRAVMKIELSAVRGGVDTARSRLAEEECAVGKDRVDISRDTRREGARDRARSLETRYKPNLASRAGGCSQRSRVRNGDVNRGFTGARPKIDAWPRSRTRNSAIRSPTRCKTTVSSGFRSRRILDQRAGE